MHIPDWLGSIACLITGAGIYLYGYRNGANGKEPPDPCAIPLGAAEIARLSGSPDAPTTKRARPEGTREDAS